MINCSSSHVFSDKLLDYSNVSVIFGFLVPFLFASFSSISQCSSCIWIGYWIAVWILLFWTASHPYCRIAGNLLHSHLHAKSTDCSKVIKIWAKYVQFKIHSLFHFQRRSRIVMAVALTYLSCIHIHRQYNNNGAYTVDITGPLMIITQKVTTLAFSIHDGFARDIKVIEIKSIFP